MSDDAPKPPTQLRAIGLCVGPECDRQEDPANMKHLCATHNKQRVRGRELTPIEPGFPHHTRYGKGYPRIPAELKTLFRELTPVAIEALKMAAQNGTAEGADAKDRAVAVKAAETILSRAWGPPPQKIELSLEQVSNDELEAEVKRLEAAAASEAKKEDESDDE